MALPTIKLKLMCLCNRPGRLTFFGFGAPTTVGFLMARPPFA